VEASPERGSLRVPGCAGISYSTPVVGAQETYVRHNYGDLGRRDTVKNYTAGRLTLKIVAVEDELVRLEETQGFEWYSTCHVQAVRLDRRTGKFQALEEPGWSLVTDANKFTSGSGTGPTGT
jgi:hypothetical protein